MGRAISEMFVLFYYRIFVSAEIEKPLSRSRIFPVAVKGETAFPVG